MAVILRNEEWEVQEHQRESGRRQIPQSTKLWAYPGCRARPGLNITEVMVNGTPHLLTITSALMIEIQHILTKDSHFRPTHCLLCLGLQKYHKPQLELGGGWPFRRGSMFFHSPIYSPWISWQTEWRIRTLQWNITGMKIRSCTWFQKPNWVNPR